MDASFDGMCASWRDVADCLLPDQVDEFDRRERAGDNPAMLLVDARAAGRDNMWNGLI